ncbi:CO dehydrogenase flavoC-terminal domain protein [Mycobacterium xenopi 3993]|nr:CO dehydrogenase flavoC-terminal domain protein [Mycobacterium xenopi 3993]
MGRAMRVCHRGARAPARRLCDRRRRRGGPARRRRPGEPLRCGAAGLGSTPRRASAAEQAVVGQRVDDITAADIGHLAVSGLDDIPADLQGSARYRARVGAIMVARAWASATAEAKEQPRHA